MDAYFVTGPFHFFNTINLKMNEYKNSKAELFIVNMFSGAELYVERARKSGLFENVYLLNNTVEWEGYAYSKKTKNQMNRYSIYLHKLIQTFKQVFPKIFIDDYKKMPFYLKKYSNIFIAGTITYIDVFLIVQTKYYNANLYCFDDGLGTRTENRDTLSKQEKIAAFIGAKIAKHYIDGVYFYSPDMLIGKYNAPIIKQECPFVNNRKILNHFKEIYGINSNVAACPRSTYYFEGGFDSYDGLIESARNYSNKEKQIITSILKEVGNDEFCLKLHPRSSMKVDGMYIIDENVPAEILMMKNDLENSIFISALSVTLFNPKFIFNKEPYIIFTYKLLGINISSFCPYDEYEFRDIIDKTLVQKYQNKNRIFIPETMEQLMEIIQKIKNNGVKK